MAANRLAGVYSSGSPPRLSDKTRELYLDLFQHLSRIGVLADEGLVEGPVDLLQVETSTWHGDANAWLDLIDDSNDDGDDPGDVPLVKTFTFNPKQAAGKAANAFKITLAHDPIEETDQEHVESKGKDDLCQDPAAQQPDNTASSLSPVVEVDLPTLPKPPTCFAAKKQ
mmetsp:Transcript_41544/g.47929  ORF Transcript_41544/g.47929 Transcript_41544/m.47929 type:complete len:169 (-) Transcript_41544:8-514(-)